MENIPYNHTLKQIYLLMDKLIDKYKLNNDVPKDHYFLQLKNLVDKKSNFLVQINRVLQIAYNIGQLYYLITKNEINEEVVEFIDKHDLFKLKTYISKENQLIINTYLTEYINNK
jgi:hypothetical protein